MAQKAANFDALVLGWIGFVFKTSLFLLRFIFTICQLIYVPIYVSLALVSAVNFLATGQLNGTPEFIDFTFKNFEIILITLVVLGYLANTFVGKTLYTYRLINVYIFGVNLIAILKYLFILGFNFSTNFWIMMVFLFASVTMYAISLLEAKIHNPIKQVGDKKIRAEFTSESELTMSRLLFNSNNLNHTVYEIRGDNIVLAFILRSYVYIKNQIYSFFRGVIFYYFFKKALYPLYISSNFLSAPVGHESTIRKGFRIKDERLVRCVTELKLKQPGQKGFSRLALTKAFTEFGIFYAIFSLLFPYHKSKRKELIGDTIITFFSDIKFKIYFCTTILALGSTVFVLPASYSDGLFFKLKSFVVYASTHTSFQVWAGILLIALVSIGILLETLIKKCKTDSGVKDLNQKFYQLCRDIGISLSEETDDFDPTFSILDGRALDENNKYIRVENEYMPFLSFDKMDDKDILIINDVEPRVAKNLEKYKAQFLHSLEKWRIIPKSDVYRAEINETGYLGKYEIQLFYQVEHIFNGADLSESRWQDEWKKLIVEPLIKSENQSYFFGEVLDDKLTIDPAMFVAMKTSPHVLVCGQTRSGKTKIRKD